jgi:hypothetical protein
MAGRPSGQSGEELVQHDVQDVLVLVPALQEDHCGGEDVSGQRGVAVGLGDFPYLRPSAKCTGDCQPAVPEW